MSTYACVLGDRPVRRGAHFGSALCKVIPLQERRGPVLTAQVTR